jgi:hypothetical protein
LEQRAAACLPFDGQKLHGRTSDSTAFLLGLDRTFVDPEIAIIMLTFLAKKPQPDFDANPAFWAAVEVVGESRASNPALCDCTRFWAMPLFRQEYDESSIVSAKPENLVFSAYW